MLMLEQVLPRINWSSFWIIWKKMSLECKVQVFLNNITGKKAEAIRKALEPDNVDFPKDLSFKLDNNGGVLVFTFEGKGNIRTLISTIDEVLEQTQVVLRVTADA